MAGCETKKIKRWGARGGGHSPYFLQNVEPGCPQHTLLRGAGHASGLQAAGTVRAQQRPSSLARSTRRSSSDRVANACGGSWSKCSRGRPESKSYVAPRMASCRAGDVGRGTRAGSSGGSEARPGSNPEEGEGAGGAQRLGAMRCQQAQCCARPGAPLPPAAAKASHEQLPTLLGPHGRMPVK